MSKSLVQIKTFATYGGRYGRYGFYDLVLKTPHHPKQPLETILMSDSQLTLLKRATKTRFEGNYSIDVNPKEKLKTIFGSTFTGETRESSSRLQRGQPIKIAGITVPDKPPEPDNCCMSGCINCVWELYKDDLKEWNDKRNEAARKLNKSQSNFIWPKSFHPPLKVLNQKHIPPEMRQSEGASQSSHSHDDNLWGDLPIAIRVFADTEKKIKARRNTKIT